MVSPRATAVPHTPLPIAMRRQAGFPWNGPSTSSFPLRKVKPGPAEFGQAVIDQRRHVGGVGDPIALAFEQCGQFYSEVAV